MKSCVSKKYSSGGGCGGAGGGGCGGGGGGVVFGFSSTPRIEQPTMIPIARL